MKTFTKEFNKYACTGDFITLDLGSIQIKARIESDYDSRPDDSEFYEDDTIQAWNNDDWFYCGIVLSVWADDICIDGHAASLWRIECNYPGGDNSYLREVSNELLEENWEDIKESVKAYKRKVNEIEID